MPATQKGMVLTDWYVYMHSCIHTQTLSRALSLSLSHTHTHARTHARAHTHTHTHRPYNRGSTPPAFHPLPLYTPVDTRDENGKVKEADGRVFGRNYFSNHSRSMVTAGGYLNGLPRAGDGYRPNRVCGKGVIEEVRAREESEKLQELEKLTGDDPNAQLFLEVLKKSKVKTVPIEDQIAARIVSLHGGGDWGQPLEFLPIQLVKGPDLLELDLSSNKLRRIPDSICNMPNLTRMNLDSNCLEALPQVLYSFVSVRACGLVACLHACLCVIELGLTLQKKFRAVVWVDKRSE